MTASYTFFDLETFHITPNYARVAQFAAVYADEDFHECAAPVNIFCRQSHDMLPSPIACAVTGFLPDDQKGLSERLFSESILKALQAHRGVHGGFNTHRFDSMVLRFLFYRNALAPYALEQDGSRFDWIDMLRTLYALRPEGLVVPHNEGVPTLALEPVAEANGLIKEKAHDALSDARTTLALARFIQQLQPRLSRYLIANRSVRALKALTQDHDRVWLHVSGQYSMQHGHMAPVQLIGSPHNNRLLAYDLRVDPDEFSGLCTE